MNLKRHISGAIRRTLLALWLVFNAVGLPAATATNSQAALPVLKTRTDTFTNVVVTSRSKTDLMIEHAGGIGNIKIKDIEDPEALIALGLKTAEELARTNSTFALGRFLTGTNAPLQKLTQNPALAQQMDRLKEVNWSVPLIAGIAAVTLLLYLFTCYCMKLVCQKAGHPPGGLIWIPIVQWLPMFKAARMSGWWLLGMFVPLLNLVAWILWSFKIVKARGKSVLWAILLLLPGLSVIAFLYLAFSGTGGEQPTPDESSDTKFKI